MPHFVYILFSQSLDRYYIGSAADLAGRLRRHNANHKGFTGRANDWKLVYSETFDNKTAALAREKQLKKWKNRQRIEALALHWQPPNG